jgi:uncharacterized protein
MVSFVGRAREMDLLESDWDSQKNSFVVVYGRRRIGKTRLLQEFTKDKEVIRYTAGDTNKKIQIQEFKGIIGNYLKDDFLLNQEIEDWENLFAYLTKVLEKDKKICIWIDEFSYIVKNDSSVTSTLQKFIDGFLRDSRIFFVVSGSLFGLMNDKVLSNSSPLYGRRTRDLLLSPLGFGSISSFLSFEFSDELKTFLTLNGIPEYLQVVSKYKDYLDFVSNEFFLPEGYFYREPFFLLSQEFKEIKTYFSILNAIAYGNSKPNDIANFIGVSSREIYPYLELLINYGFIFRETSSGGDKKRGIYFIRDNFLDFWFNFVHKNREKIESRRYKFLPGEIETYFGKRFEIFIRDNFFNFFESFDSCSRWWHKDKEIDVVALNEKKKEILFGECKWKEKVNALEVLKDLSEKTKFVDWNLEKRKESFAVFAKSFSKRVKEFEGKKVHCFDLGDLGKEIRKSKGL